MSKVPEKSLQYIEKTVISAHSPDQGHVLQLHPLSETKQVTREAWRNRNASRDVSGRVTVYWLHEGTRRGGAAKLRPTKECVETLAAWWLLRFWLVWPLPSIRFICNFKIWAGPSIV